LNNSERDIKARMAAGNETYYAMTKIMTSREISKSTKLEIYRRMISPIVMYGCEGWTMSGHMEESQSMGKKDFKDGIWP
jgi:hypothetical protein